MAEELNGAAPAAAESAPAPAPAAAPAPSPAVETPAAPPPSFDEDLRAASYKIHAKHNPPRENGKFAPHIPTATPLEDAAPEATVTDQAQAKAPEPAPVEPAIEAPQSWSAEEKAHWAKVPPEAQSVIARRETEAHRQISQQGQQIKAHEPLRAVAEQHAEYFRRNGMKPEAALNELVRVSQYLDRDPATAIRELAQRYRVDLQQLASGQPQQQQNDYVDHAARAEVRQLKAFIAQIQSEQQGTKLQAVTTAIDKFAKDHPYFNDLEGEIEAQVAVLQQRNGNGLSPEEMLSQAYDKARWANPTIRERILADQRKKDEEKAKAERETQVKDAKRFSTLNQRGTSAAAPVKGTWEDTLRSEVEKRVPRRA